MNPNLRRARSRCRSTSSRSCRARAAAVPARRRERRRQRSDALPLARPPPAETAAEHPPARPDGRCDQAGDGERRVRRHPDADPLEADAGGRTRLSRPVATAAGSLLCPAAVAADREAAARHRRLRAVLPDRNLLPRRGPPRRPCAGNHAARRRDGVSRPGVHPRADGDDDLDGVARVHRRRARDAVCAHDVRGGRQAVRVGQARPPLRPRDRGRDRSDARVEVRRLRRRRDGALPPSSEDVLAQRARRARGVRQGVGGEGPCVHRRRRGRRGSVADREVPVGGGAGALRHDPRADPAVRGRQPGP